MENLSLLVQADKNFSVEKLEKQLRQLAYSNFEYVILIAYPELSKDKTKDFSVYSLAENEDENLSHLLSWVKTDDFMFFDPSIDYPIDFFEGFKRNAEKERESENKSIWIKSLIAFQQSNYGLCSKNKTQSKSEIQISKESVIYEKTEVLKLNTDKMPVHQELAGELYRYAVKKNLELKRYSIKRSDNDYYTHFADLILACQKQAQQEFKFFPAFFVAFFLIFGIGAAFHPLFFLVFLIGMSTYLLAIVLEAFGLSTIKKNGALVPVLMLLFPFVHLVYGLESLISLLKSKTT